MANTESVAALLKDPRKKIKKKPQDQSKATGIANAIQRRIANGSYDKGKGRTSAFRAPGTTTLPGPTAPKKPVAGGSTVNLSKSPSLASLGKQGNRSAGYAAAIQKRLSGRGSNATAARLTHPVGKKRGRKRIFF